MDIHTREALFAAAGVLLIASPLFWAGGDRLLRRWRRQRAQIRSILQDLRARDAELEDATALEVQRRSELLAEPVVASAERIVFEEFLRSAKRRP